MDTPTRAQIEAALKKYGDHTYECSSNETIDPTSKPPCDCGWDEWKGLIAAAQVGELDEQTSSLIGFTQFDLDKDRNRTIERCAQVAEKRAKAFAGDAVMELEAIAAAIRRLKEQS